MEVIFKQENKDKLIEYLNDFLLQENDEKIVVLGSIDNNTFERLKDSIKNFTKLFIGVSKKYTTKKIVLDLANKDNVFYQNNNDYRNMLKENIIILKNANSISILVIPFELKEEIIENANNTLILIKLDNNEKNIESITNVIENYKQNIKEYPKLNEEAINFLSEKKAFRNEKADSLDKEINKDEIIKSFRSIQGVENKDEFLKMVEVHNKIKNKGFLKNEIEFSNMDDQTSNLNKDFDLEDDDIEFE